VDGLTNWGGGEHILTSAGLQAFWKSGTPGMVYLTSKEEGETHNANCGGTNGSVEWGG